jgi:hypothetical protein
VASQRFTPKLLVAISTSQEIVVNSNTPVFLTKNGYGTMVLISIEQYSALTDDIEHKPDEADEAAEKSDVRYSASRVFGGVRSRIHESEKV